MCGWICVRKKNNNKKKGLDLDDPSFGIVIANERIDIQWFAESKCDCGNPIIRSTVSKQPGTYCSLVSLRLPLAKIFKDERAENIDNGLGNDGTTTNKRAYGSGVLFS